MIRLTTALLMLGVSIASATTALAQDGCFYGSCNPEASWCRLLCGSDPQQQNVRNQPGGYVAATHHRRMYMYEHGSNTHKHQKAPLKKVP
jgi:hypothetical protein